MRLCVPLLQPLAEFTHSCAPLCTLNRHISHLLNHGWYKCPAFDQNELILKTWGMGEGLADRLGSQARLSPCQWCDLGQVISLPLSLSFFLCEAGVHSLPTKLPCIPFADARVCKAPGTEPRRADLFPRYQVFRSEASPASAPPLCTPVLWAPQFRRGFNQGAMRSAAAAPRGWSP